MREISANVAETRDRAAAFSRRDDIGSGMRLQIICRETEAEAADKLIRNIPEDARDNLKCYTASSKANQRVQESLTDQGLWPAPHLWSCLTRLSPGGVGLVSKPELVVATLQKLIDAGCHSFYLSGYLHHEEAARFGN